MTPKKRTPPRSHLDVRPVTPETWADFEALFLARGGPSYCWCAPYRFADAHQVGKAEKRARMHALVKDGTPIGVLAYDDETPAGWCSIAPRETYVKLERSRVMPRVSTAPTWTVMCFYVPRARRTQGIAHVLLAGAIRHARAAGAKEIEAYPYDTAGVTSTHMGHSSLYAAAGFVRDEGRRWVWRPPPRSARR